MQLCYESSALNLEFALWLTGTSYKRLSSISRTCSQSREVLCCACIPHLNKLLKPFCLGLATGDSDAGLCWLRSPGAGGNSPSAGCVAELALLLALLSSDSSCGTLLSRLQTKQTPSGNLNIGFWASKKQSCHLCDSFEFNNVETANQANTIRNKGF